jgi:predicted transcriptional regulator
MSNVNKISVPLDPDLVRAIEEVLAPGQSVTGFIEEAVRLAVIKRQFVRKGINARDQARASGRYTDSGQVLRNLEAVLKDREKGRG